MFFSSSFSESSLIAWFELDRMTADKGPSQPKSASFGEVSGAI